MSSNHGRLSRDYIGKTLSINGRQVFDSTCDLTANNGVFQGTLTVDGSPQILSQDLFKTFSYGVGGTYGLFSPQSNDATVTADPILGGLSFNATPQAFTATTPQGGLGTLDHVKFLAYRTDGDSPVAAATYTAFTAPDDGSELVYEGVDVGVKQYLPNPVPVGIAGGVIDQTKDVRLCCGGLGVLDPDNYLTFDVLFADTQIYAVYEHLPFLKPGWPSPPAYTGPNTVTAGDYHGFTHLIPLAERPTTGDPLTNTVNVKFCYNKQQGYVRWLINDQERARVSNLGMALDRRLRVLDHNGPDVQIIPTRLCFGLNLFTLLDMHEPSKGDTSDLALVRLCTPSTQYVNPRLDRVWPGGNPTPDTTFLDASSLLENRLFGQGCQEVIKQSLVYTRGVILLTP